MPEQITDTLISWATDLEDEALQQALRTSRLPWIAGHVALMPDAHWGMGSTVGSVIPTRGAILPAAVGVDIGCFRGDTRVPLLNGRQMTLVEMSSLGAEHWVYSVDKQGEIVPGRATARMTRSDASLVRVIVSGGDEIVCTPDHPFMLNDGTYRAASELRFNDSLMPLYRKWQTRDGYESVSNGKGSARQTHVLVYEALNGPVPEGMVVHHKNVIHFDNDPSNLMALDTGEHSRYHRSLRHGLDNASSEFQRRRLAGIRRRKEDPAKLAKMVATGTENITTYMREHSDEFKAAVAGNGKRGAPYLARFNVTERPCDDCGEVQPNPASLRWHKKREHAYNHKVIAVDVLDERSDVYCLQVEEHHNFALAAGVFVHNCGMIAARVGLHEDQLPDTITPMMPLFRDRIPAGVGRGRGRSGKRDDLGGGQPLHKFPKRLEEATPFKYMDEHLKAISRNQLGSLGSGNHFVEVCVDQNGDVWIVLHSGSRGVGNKLAQYHIKIAKGLMADYLKEGGTPLEDPDLAHLVEGTPEFDAYIADMLWAQDFAATNREVMMTEALRSFWEVVGYRIGGDDLAGYPDPEQTVNCHHNFTLRETIFGGDGEGESVWITRKGAISAWAGQWGIIPGSMGTNSYITKGLGNEASYRSSAHGAGRRMSRGRARRELTIESFTESMAGKIWNSNDAKALLDEAPASYKDVEVVMENQKDLVEVQYTLHAILNFKGVS